MTKKLSVMGPTNSSRNTERYEPKVLFERWIDPLIKPSPPEAKDELDDGYDMVRSEFADGIEQSPYSGTVMMTPMGVIPLGAHNLPSKKFNFWIAHTNFHLTRKCVQAFEKTPGVEVLRIFTPYRAWFAIGKAFEQEEVLNGVKNSLIRAVSTTKKKETKPSYKPKDWAVICNPDGSYTTLRGEENELKDLIASDSNAILMAASWLKRGGNSGV